jgi:hypothetical protein
VTSIASSSAALSLLQAMNASSTAPDLASLLYGSPAAAAGNPVTALQNAVKNQTTGVAQEAKQPEVARDIAAFRKAVANAKDAKTLLADPVARKVLLTANGLGDQTDYAALATKALTSDTTKSDSLASKLSNKQWLTAAKTFDFANQGLSVLKKSSVLDTITNGYAEVKWRQSLDQTTPGLSNALDFRTRASTITSAYQILGDATFRDVVTTALGIPKEIAYQSLDAQAKAITDHVDITKFKSSNFVEQFTRRYLVAKATDTSTQSSTTTQNSGLLV